MAVHLKKKAVPAEATPLSESMERALLAILMYFPHQKSRELASDFMAGLVSLTVGNVRKITKAIRDYGNKRLEFVDPGFHVFRARDTLQAFTGEKKLPRARARARKKRVIGRMTKCR